MAAIEQRERYSGLGEPLRSDYHLFPQDAATIVQAATLGFTETMAILDPAILVEEGYDLKTAMKNAGDAITNLGRRLINDEESSNLEALRFLLDVLDRLTPEHKAIFVDPVSPIVMFPEEDGLRGYAPVTKPTLDALERFRASSPDLDFALVSHAIFRTPGVEQKPFVTNVEGIQPKDLLAIAHRTRLETFSFKIADGRLQSIPPIE